MEIDPEADVNVIGLTKYESLQASMQLRPAQLYYIHITRAHLSLVGEFGARATKGHNAMLAKFSVVNSTKTTTAQLLNDPVCSTRYQLNQRRW